MFGDVLCQVIFELLRTSLHSPAIHPAPMGSFPKGWFYRCSLLACPWLPHRGPWLSCHGPHTLVVVLIAPWDGTNCAVVVVIVLLQLKTRKGFHF